MCSPKPGSAHREFARWKVNSLALERKDFSVPLPLAPEFTRNIRLLGRRPNLQQVIETLIKKYGTHFLLSATLGGKGYAWLGLDWATKPGCVQTRLPTWRH